jgi:hypothetical protein
MRFILRLNYMLLSHKEMFHLSSKVRFTDGGKPHWKDWLQPKGMVRTHLKLSLCLTSLHAKNSGGVEAKLHAFLTSAPHWGEWLASGPGLFTPGE